MGGNLIISHGYRGFISIKTMVLSNRSLCLCQAAGRTSNQRSRKPIRSRHLVPLAPDPQSDLGYYPLDNDALLPEAEFSVSEIIQSHYDGSSRFDSSLLPEAYQRTRTHAWSTDNGDEDRGSVAGYFFETLDMGRRVAPRGASSSLTTSGTISLHAAAGEPSYQASGTPPPPTPIPEYRFAVGESGGLVDMLRTKQDTPRVFERVWSVPRTASPEGLSARRSNPYGSDRSSGPVSGQELPASLNPPAPLRGRYLGAGAGDRAEEEALFTDQAGEWVGIAHSGGLSRHVILGRCSFPIFK